MIEVSSDRPNIIGSTYSTIVPNIYEQFKNDGDAEIFERLVLDLMLNKYSDDKELTDYILNLPRDKQRMAVLAVIDGDNILWSKMNSFVNGCADKFEHIKDVIKIINKFVKDGEVERKKYGEVMTPITLVREMLDTLPKEVWSNPNLKWLDPANGAGTFPFVVVYKLMIGLKDWQPDVELRYKHIVENMIYTCELQSRNVFLWLCGIDPKDEYTTNTYWGSFLDDAFNYHMKNVWNVDKFDIIIGNPPYQEQVGPKKTKSIWNLFVKKSISLLSNNGLMTMVHPSGWRSLDGDFKDIQMMFKRNLLYLEMHDDKDGQDMFGATTSYDWYCYSSKSVEKTKIKDQKGLISDIDLSKWEFIPAGGFDIFSNLIAKHNEDKVDVIYSRSAYGTDKSHMSRERINDFIYPCVYTIIKDTTINLFWSVTNNNGHFGIPKVIWSNGMASPPTVDLTGQYGLTQFSYAIVDSVDNLASIKKAMDSDNFIETMKLCYMSSGNRFDRKVISTFRKDFWRYFL